MPELRTETMTVNMGPQHPSTHGVLRLVLELDGETVVSVAPTIGYLHTGIEKTDRAEEVAAGDPARRADGLPQLRTRTRLATCLAVEKLLGLEMPDRVKWIRVLLAELQRINSHLVWLGTHAMDMGAITVMLYTLPRARAAPEHQRAHRRLPHVPELHPRRAACAKTCRAGFHEAVRAILDRLPGQDRRVRGPADEERDLRSGARRASASCRCADALAWGLVGPIARGSGSTYDVRKAFPYCGYETFDFDVPMRRGRRRVRPLPGAPRRDARERADLPAGARRASRRAGAWARRRPARGAAAQGQGLHGDGSADPALPDLLAGLHGARRRGLRAGRGAARRARLPRRLGRRQPAVAREDARRRR